MTAARGCDHARAVVAHYDERAATYDESPLHRGLCHLVADLPELADAATVLDVATGTGLLLRALAGRRTGQRLVGVDLSARMVGVAGRALPGAAFAIADAAALPLADRSVDVVSCITALHLFDDPGAVFGEWARVLADGGLVVTATFAPTEVVDELPGRGGFRRSHEPYRTAGLVTEALAPHGFRPVRHLGWTHGDDRLVVCLLRSGAQVPA